MKKVLRIMSSPRGEASISAKLGNAIVERVKGKYPDSVVKERNLAKNVFPHLDEALINSFFTPTESLSAEQVEIIKYSNEAIAELQEADIIVIDTPMYNFSISSTLKTYLDHIVRRGVTFTTTEKYPGGIEGLLKNKKVYLAFSASGIYSEGGAFQSYDFVAPHLKAVLGWVGMKDITVFRAEGLAIPTVQETALQKGIDSIVID
ncbi:MAG: NAD(P)H-dependent oxidoreductase [Bacteroidota bacterium]